MSYFYERVAFSLQEPTDAGDCCLMEKLRNFRNGKKQKGRKMRTGEIYIHFPQYDGNSRNDSIMDLVLPLYDLRSNEWYP